MFEQTGVIEPRLDIAAMGQLAASYRRLASGLTSAHTDATDSVAHVLASNDGPAAQQFSQSETGTGSIAVHLGELAEAATRTSNAYARGAVGGLQATVAMQAVAYSRMGQYLQMVERRTPSVFVAIFVQVVRFQLLQLESRGATAWPPPPSPPTGRLWPDRSTASALASTEKRDHGCETQNPPAGRRRSRRRIPRRLHRGRGPGGQARLRSRTRRSRQSGGRHGPFQPRQPHQQQAGGLLG